jgi:hypothetical protein
MRLRMEQHFLRSWECQHNRSKVCEPIDLRTLSPFFHGRLPFCLQALELRTKCHLSPLLMDYSVWETLLIENENLFCSAAPKAVKKSNFSNNIVESIRRERDTASAASGMAPKRNSFASPACQRPEITQDQLNFSVKRISPTMEPPAKRRKLNPTSENAVQDTEDDLDPVSSFKVKYVSM